MATRRINQAIDSLTRNGGGPAHINMRIAKHWARGDDKLEMARKITRHNLHSGNWPSLDGKKIMIAVGQHHSFSDAGQQALEEFVSKYNAVVYVNHISNYHGAGSVNGNIRLFTGHSKHLCPDIAITIGGHFGDYAVDSFFRTSPIEHWRVAEDGNYSDSYSKLKHVFECRELDFFSCMNQQAGGTADHSYLELWQDETDSLTLPETYPLSQAMVAQKLSPSIPSGSVLHFAILNSMRFWEFFPLDHSIRCYCNVAGFGIDGCLSTFLGQSVASEQLCYLVIGDLSFFYDMNSLGIRCLKNNIRIILVNNNGGCEFRLKSNAADKFGDDSNRHIAATDHFGESAEGWVRNNGFNYIGVRSEDELNAASSIMASPSDKPVLMEVFTTIKDDAQALQIINMHLHDQLDLSSGSVKAIKNIRRTVGQHLSRDMKDKLKRFLK
jgi:2-succinyl-5-enolpyruvyl-6-hydroxy-3-cyclohexene-1-carboxylate synthase